MAKEDFCFTYYDGDAARDKAHMTRLERGAYDDLISAQRKRGHLSIDDIKRVLSKDFESCWPAMEWILLKDDADKYFIEWVDKSIEKMRKQSNIQKEKINKYWAEKKPKPNKNDTTDILQYNNSIKLEKPLVNENEDGDEDEIEEKELHENVFCELSAADIENSIEYLDRVAQKKFTTHEISNRWEGFKIQYGKDFYYSRSKVIQHFRNWLKQQNGHPPNAPPNGKKSTYELDLEQKREAMRGLKPNY